MMEQLGSTISLRHVRLGAVAVLLALAVAMPQAGAVEEMRTFNGGKKSSKSKSCPKGKRYSQKKRGCVKTSCGTGRVWSGEAEACFGRNSAALTDEDLYLGAGEGVHDGRYADALDLLGRIADKRHAKVLNLTGYATRKLGDVDKGIGYYHEALALDPDYTKARQYLGEGYLQKGDVAKAEEQLDQIADRCGGPCEDYTLLAEAIVAHVTGGEVGGW